MAACTMRVLVLYHHLQKFCRNSEEIPKKFCRTTSKKFCGTSQKEPATFFVLQKIFFLQKIEENSSPLGFLWITGV